MKNLFKLSATALISIIFSLNVQSKSIYVDANSAGGSGDQTSPYSTITTALTAAADLDTIFVLGGTYPESLTIDKNITLIGDDQSESIIDGNNGEYTIKIDGVGATVEGFVIKGARTLVQIISADENQGEKPRLAFNFLDGGNNSNGIELIKSAKTQIHRNVIIRCDTFGIKSTSAEDLLNITNNNFIQIKQTAIITDKIDTEDVISENIFYKNDKAIVINDISEGIENLNYNLYFGNEGGNVFSFEIDDQQVTTNLPVTLDSIQNVFENPLFVDEAGNNFELRPGSPAIDKGISINNNNNTQNDIGAFEFEISDYVDFKFEIFEGTKTVRFDITSTGNYNSDATFWAIGKDDLKDTIRGEATFTINSKFETFQVCLSVFDINENQRFEICKVIATNPVDFDNLCYTPFSYSENSEPLAFVINAGTIQVQDAEIFWDFGDGQIENINKSVSKTFEDAGNYEVCLTVTSELNNCQSTTCQIIPVDITNIPCQAEFSSETDYVGNVVSFFDNSMVAAGNIIDTWTWDFGDGNVIREQNPTHTYEKSGVYDVCLNISVEDTECTSDYCEKIVVGTIGTEEVCEASFDYIIEDLKLNLFNSSSDGVTKFQWNIGNNVSYNNENISHLFNKAGVFNVCLTVLNDATGCQAEHCEEIVIGNLECQANFEVIMATNLVRFYDASIGNVSQRKWDFGNGTTSDIPNPILEFEKNGIYKVCLTTYQQDSDCLSEVCKYVNVTNASGGDNSISVLSAAFSYVTDPGTKSIAFKDESKGNADKWYWTLGDGNFSKDSVFTHSYEEKGIYKVCLEIYNSVTGKSNSVCEEVNLDEQDCNISADFAVFNESGALADQPVIVRDRSEGMVDGWAWNFGDGATSSLQNGSHQYNKPGIYKIKLAVAESTTGCVDVIEKEIKIGLVTCAADFNFRVDVETNTLEVGNNSTGLDLNFFWIFGDGNFSIMENTSHTYENPGLYDVGLVIQNDKNCKDFYEVPIQVGSVKCEADFEYFVDSTTNTVHFTSDVIGSNMKYLWLFGDGTTSEDINPSHSFTKSGYHTAKLTVYKQANDASNRCMDSHEETILVGSEGQDCEADFFFDVDGFMAQCWDKSKGENLSYSWYFGPGSIISTMQNPMWQFNEAGYQLICLTVENTNGIEHTKCKYVPINVETKKCFADFDYIINDLTNTVSFFDQSLGNPTKWNWNFGDGNESSSKNPIHTYDSTGYFAVQLISGDPNSDCASSSWQLINIDKPELLTAGIGYTVGDILLKSGGYPVDFIGVATGTPGSYAWDFGDGGIFEGASEVTHIYDTTGNYFVCLIVTDENTEESDTICELIVVEDQEVSIQYLQNGAFDFELTSYPSPFTDVANITYVLPVKSDAIISIYNLKGEKLDALNNISDLPGKHTIQFNGEHLVSGAYLVKIETVYGSQTNVLIKN